jgi:hypothetical protein
MTSSIPNNMSPPSKSTQNTGRATGNTAPADWVRRSSRANAGVNYFQDTYADLLEDTPENSVMSDDETDDATDVFKRNSPEVSSSNSSDEDPVLPPGRTRKAVKHSDTNESSNEDPVVPPSRGRSAATGTKRAPSHSTSESTDDSAGEDRASVPSTAPSSPEVPLMQTSRLNRANVSSPAPSSPEVPLKQMFLQTGLNSAMRISLNAEELHTAAAGNDEPSSDATKLSDDQVPFGAGSASSTESSEDVAVVPSKANKFKFTTDSPAGRTAAELDSMFRPPPRMPRWKTEVDSSHAIKLSYSQLGPHPKEGLADQLVKEMETQHAMDVEEAEEENKK